MHLLVLLLLLPALGQGASPAEPLPVLWNPAVTGAGRPFFDAQGRLWAYHGPFRDPFSVWDVSAGARTSVHVEGRWFQWAALHDAVGPILVATSTGWVAVAPDGSSSPVIGAPAGGRIRQLVRAADGGVLAVEGDVGVRYSPSMTEEARYDLTGCSSVFAMDARDRVWASCDQRSMVIAPTGRREAPWSGQVIVGTDHRAAVVLGTETLGVDLVEERVSWTRPGAIHAATYSPDGSRLALAGADGVSILDLAGAGRPEVVVRAGGHGGDVRALAFDRGATVLAVAAGQALMVFDASTGEGRTQAFHAVHPSAVAVGPGLGFVITGDDHGLRYVWRPDGTTIEVAPPTVIDPLPGVTFGRGTPASVRALVVSADGSRAASGHQGGWAHVFDPATGEGSVTLPLDADLARLAPTTDSPISVAPSMDCPPFCGGGDYRRVVPPALSSTGDRVATAGLLLGSSGPASGPMDGSVVPRSVVRVWSLPDGRPRGTWLFDQPVVHVGLEPDGTLLVKVGSDLVALGDGAPRFVSRDPDSWPESWGTDPEWVLEQARVRVGEGRVAFP